MEILKWRSVPQKLERCRCKVSGALQEWGEKLNANEKWNYQWLSSLLAGSRSKKQVLEYHQVVCWQGYMIEILPIYIYNKHYCKEQKCEDKEYTKKEKEEWQFLCIMLILPISTFTLYFVTFKYWHSRCNRRFFNALLQHIGFEIKLTMNLPYSANI